MSILEEAKESLERMQNFDCESLSRDKDLGQHFNFIDAVSPSKKLVRLYGQISSTVLEDFPDNITTQIKQQVDADYNRFQQILDFDPKQESATQTRDNIINQISTAYDTAFQKLYPYISYGVSKSVDFQRLETEARSTIQSINDHAKKLTEQLEENQTQADQVLTDIRKVAAEQGVSQQAIYFKEESEKHEEQADIWRVRTIWLSVGLGCFAFLSIFLHKAPWLKPEDAFQNFQLITSKILIFAVIAYMLFLSAKNFLSHKHNSIINKHRQNALMTYSALADAASSEESKDIVLNHAASCIFSPQETGYIKNESAGSNKSIVELLPKTTMKLSE
ncbi:MAG: hypothetical protein DBP03_08245 [gamma proteobacterium symbiont of Ctena orbiculata]|nr:MAG: hypothetical protein DBP03_08245 [gamma proteobacterium symbiont of Ctena orbiculata]